MKKVLSFKEIDRPLFWQKQIEDIFFEASSRREFSSAEVKADFFQKWCGDYLLHFPEEFFLMIEGEKLCGYLSGCRDSKLKTPSLNLFADFLEKFPAHLHINFSPFYRGQNLGGQLIEHYSRFLRANGVSGVHIVTSPGMRNVKFYNKLNFHFTSERILNEKPLLFMGLNLRD